MTEQILPEDLWSLGDTWKQNYVGTLMAFAVKGHRDDGDNFSLDSVEGPVKLKKAVERAPMQLYHANAPMELVHMDYLTIEHGKTGKDVNILVITDYYSRFAQAVVNTSQTALTTATAAWNDFFHKYGFPEKIITDQGTNFESELFQSLCSVARITKLRTTSYHPQTYGNCERFNATLINMIKTLEYEDKVVWTKHVPTLCAAYNSTRHISTGFSPFWLMMGRKPRLAIDLNIGTNLPEHGPSSSSKYVLDLQKRLNWADKVAKKQMERGLESQEVL